MKSKKQLSSHITDISKPKRGVTASEPQLVIPKRSFIVPVSTPDDDALVPEPAAIKPMEGKSIQPAAVAAPTAPEQKPAPKAKAESEPQPDAAQTADSDVSEDPLEPADTADNEGEDDPKSSKTNASVRKALEEAQREQELRQFIENRDFFVPINAAARKRSLKVSIGLVLVELILGLLLINLMLDAGVIELLNKIPHTHFFNIH